MSKIAFINFTRAWPSAALLRREFLVQLRTVRALLCLLALLLIGGMMVTSGWPDDTVVWSQLSFTTTYLFLWISFLILFGAGVFVPGFAAMALLKERQERSWDQLSLTLISPLGVVMAKLLNVIGFYLLLVIAVAPVMSVVFFLIGLDWRQTAVAFAIILATVITLATLGMACSAVFRRIPWCVVASYVTMLIIMGLPLLPLAIIAEMSQWRWAGDWILDAAFIVCPPMMLVYAIEGLGGFGRFDYFWYHMLYQGVVSIAAILFTWRRVRRPFDGVVVSREKPLDDKAALVRRRRRFPFYLIDPLRRFKPIGDHSNPVFVRELRWGIGARKTASIRMVYLAAALFLTITILFIRSANAPDDESMRAFLTLVHGGLVCALVPPFLATTFTSERTENRIDSLRMTLVTANQIVAGKFRAAFSFMFVLFMCSLVGHIPLVLFVGSTRVVRSDIPIGIVSIFVGALLALSWTMLSSVFARKPAAAIAMSYALILLTFFGPIGSFVLITELADIRYDWQDFVPQILLYASPVSAYLAGFDGGYALGRFFPRWLASMTFLVGISGILYLLSRGLFARRQMQEK